ncbi:hypothetical protein CYANOKiyG1_03350 [Okeania sp. KiyG1]|nr:hypothetical protein CYANOKiyG1_03350 [Okeania sp. KiyG1]
MAVHITCLYNYGNISSKISIKSDQIRLNTYYLYSWRRWGGGEIEVIIELLKIHCMIGFYIIIISQCATPNQIKLSPKNSYRTVEIELVNL